MTTSGTTASRRIGNPGRLSTFSIAGRCTVTGQLGVAVATADAAAGRLVTWAAAHAGAVAMQSWPNLYAAIDMLSKLREGAAAADVLADATAQDPARDLRQIGVVDRDGRSAAWSGGECTDWAGHVTGEDFAAQGNMLTGERTVRELARVFRERTDADLAERLLRALEAGQAAGGDKRGRQCAALLVVETEEFPLWDLRVDEHPHPVAELRRIHEIARHQTLPFVRGLPTREHPEGSLSDEFIAMDLLPPPQRPGGGGGAPDDRPPPSTLEEDVRGS